MKPLPFLIFCMSCLLACKENASPKTADALQKLKLELEKKKSELADKQKIAEIEKELEAVEDQIEAVEKSGTAGAAPQTEVSAPAPAAQDQGSHASAAIIIGSKVTMRKEASVQSDKLGSFDQNEGVEVLETKNVNNEGEAILSKPITVTGSGGEVNLPKGKAVVIEKYLSETNKYEVTYQDPQKGKLSAEVDASAVETITYSTWYKVKRKNGEIGWVLGKFLKIN